MLTVKSVYREILPQLRGQIESSNIMEVARTIVDESARAKIDHWLIIAIISEESQFEVEAISRRGARGLMQVMPATFRQFSSARRMLDPAENVRVGIRYLAHLQSLGFKRTEALLQAYNQGPRATRTREISSQSRAYIPRVMDRYRRFTLIASR